MSKEYPGIKAGEKTELQGRFLELPIQSVKNAQLRQRKKKPWSVEDRFLAENMQPSTDGEIVKCTYSLRIVLKHDICCSGNPDCEVKLSIYPPPCPNFG